MATRQRPSFFFHLHPPTLPAREARFRYTFGLGGVSIGLFIILGITGALELFYYIPSLEQANSSLQLINLFVPYGQFVRSLHYWSAQALVVTSVLHMLRVVLTGAYKQPRSFNWLLGLSLLVLVLLFDFTGYALRWDEDIAWALMVATNLLKTIPGIGPGLYGLVVGGVEIGRATIVRFYGWHVFGLSIPALFFVGWHVFRVRRDGGISRLTSRPKGSPTISRVELVQREVAGALVAAILLLIITLLFPPHLGASANFENLPAEAVAPWLFIWVQQLLRLGPPFQMGVLIPVVLLVILALLPYSLDRNPEGVARWFNREGRLVQLTVLVVLALVLGFTLQGVLR